LEGYKTIKELADYSGYSKAYIDKIIRILGMHTELTKVGNKYVIDKNQENTIMKEINSKKTHTKIHTESTTETEVDFLRKQLESKNIEMERMHKLLDQQQQLTLQSNKQIESLQQQLLLSTQRDEQEEEMTDTKVTPEDQTETLEETVQEKIKSESKKWWQFWKSKKTDY